MKQFGWLHLLREHPQPLLFFETLLSEDFPTRIVATEILFNILLRCLKQILGSVEHDVVENGFPFKLSY